MKKTVNINISGYVFTMDEDAGKLLFDYMDTLQKAFKENSEGNEILNDIEFRISEILGEYVANGANAITIEQVDALISQIGKPEDFVETTEEISIESNGNETIEESTRQSATPPPPPIPDNRYSRRKLFRDTQNGLLGGVCSGFAAYLRIDVVWVRLALIAIALCIKFFPLAALYIILWIIVPAANTPLERMQMKGEKPTLHNIGKNVTDSFRENVENHTDENGYASDSRTSLRRGWDTLINIVAVLLLIILIPAVLVLGIAIVLCFIVLIAFSFGTVNVGADDLLYHHETGVVYGLICAIGWLLVIGVPFLIMTLYSLNRFHRLNTGSTRFSRWFLAMLWVVGIIMAGIGTGLCINYNERHPELREPFECVVATFTETDDEDDNIPNIQIDTITETEQLTDSIEK